MKSAFEHQGSLYFINQSGQIFKDANGDQSVWTQVGSIDLKNSFDNHILHIKQLIVKYFKKVKPKPKAVKQY